MPTLRSLVCGLLVPLAASAGPLPDAVLKAVGQYAPILVLHPQEEYLPTSAEELQKVVTPTSNGGFRLKDQTVATRRGNLAAAKAYVNVKVHDGTSEIQYWFLYAYNGHGTAYFKHLTKTLRYEGWPDASMEPCGRHEGDWEHIAVRVDNQSGRATKVYLAEHAGGEWVDPGKVTQGGRIVIYASRNGHASYPGKDRNYSETRKLGVIEFRLVNETADGPRFDTRGRTVLTGASDQRKGAKAGNLGALSGKVGPAAHAWMKYTGRWGYEETHPKGALEAQLKKSLGSTGEKVLHEIGATKALDWLLNKAGLRDECFAEAGPVPPWSKGSWTGAE